MTTAASQELSVDIDVAGPLGFVIGVAEAWERVFVNHLVTTFVKNLSSSSRLYGCHVG